MGIWKQLGGSSCGHTHPTPFLQPPTLTSSFQGRRNGGGRRGSHWDSQETLTWTETSARPTSFSAQHVTFFLLRSLVTLARVSPKDGRLPDCWVREERGKSRKASASLGLEAGWLELMSLRSPSGPDGKGRKAGREGKEEGVGENIAENGPPLELVCRVSWIICLMI